MTIGVMGCMPSLPITFPISYPENAGNMIHANAPFEMFDDCVFIRDTKRFRNEENFSSFVNKKCSNLIITLANTLKFGETNGEKYVRLLEFIDKINKPITIFGLGIQSKNDDIHSMSLPPEAIEFIKVLSQKTELIGVRGELTKKALHELCGIDNVMVTGCPSFFSRPHTLPALRKNLSLNSGRIAYSGTHYHQETEGSMLCSAIKSDYFLIEPVSKHNHIYHQSILRGEPSYPLTPYFLNKFIKNSTLEKKEIKQYFQTKYRIFRNTTEWYMFNEEFVKATYGTRFHVNMASLISGKPALWITHDSRTRELTDFLHLPSIPVEDTYNRTGQELIETNMDYSKLLENIGDLYDNFNKYLEINKLPKIKYFEFLK